MIYTYKLAKGDAGFNFIQTSPQQPVSTVNYLYFIPLKINISYKDIFYNNIDIGKPPILVFSFQDSNRQRSRLVTTDYCVNERTRSGQNEIRVGVFIKSWEGVKDMVQACTELTLIVRD